MKIFKNRRVVIALSWLVTLCIIFLMGKFMYKEEAKDFTEQKPYVSYVAKDDGTKAIYLLTQKMGYSVKRYEKPARFLSKYQSYTMVIIAPDYQLITTGKENDHLKEWVKKGNVVMFVDTPENLEDFTDRNGYKDILKNPSENVNNGFLYGEGLFVFNAESMSFSNKGLQNLDNGVVFIRALESTGNKKVIFNEFYHGIGDQGSIWDMFDTSGQIIILQLILGIVIYMYMKSRRFGGTVVVHKTSKRHDNERVFSMARIYKKAGFLPHIFTIYVSHFEKEILRYLDVKEYETREQLMELTNNDTYLRSLRVAQVIFDYDNYLKGQFTKKEEAIGLLRAMEFVKRKIHYL